MPPPDAAGEDIVFTKPVQTDRERLGRLAGSLKRMGGLSPAVETMPSHPPADHPLAFEFYLLAILHQFGFWNLEKGRYGGAWYGLHQGRRLRGSDYVWTRLHALLNERPEAFILDGAFPVTPLECRFLCDDEGNVPPLWEEHERLSRELRWHLALSGLRPLRERVTSAGDAGPAVFRELFGNLPGYCEDPHRKKLHLLYMFTTGRSDNPLRLAPDVLATPAVDYHLIRFLLRYGVATIKAEDLDSKIRQRQEVTRAEEALIRNECVAIVNQLIQLTDKKSFHLDQALFQMRLGCRDTGDPDCVSCHFASDCAQNTGLFQPVFRETSYY